MKRSTILIFGLVCVAITSAFVMAMNWRLVNVMTSPDWCARAISAEKLTGTRDASSCVGLMTIQLKSAAVVNYIYAGTIALCLLVLMAVVVAGARLKASGSADGVSVDIGSDGPSGGQQ